MSFEERRGAVGDVINALILTCLYPLNLHSQLFTITLIVTFSVAEEIYVQCQYAVSMWSCKHLRTAQLSVMSHPISYKYSGHCLVSYKLRHKPVITINLAMLLLWQSNLVSDTRFYSLFETLWNLRQWTDCFPNRRTVTVIWFTYRWQRKNTQSR
jgi:hypothetical protein